jgi:hypothetical protein
MQKYNPYNTAGNKYKSDKPDVPNVEHDEYNPEHENKKKLPDSYGLYIPPPLYETGIYKPVTNIQYVVLVIDTNNRDYQKYPNPFNFVTDRFTEEFKNVKIFQMMYITLPQFNLVKLTAQKDDNYNFMLNYITNNTVKNNDVIVNGSVVYGVCNYYNNEINFTIDGNSSLIYSIDSKKNYFIYGFSNSYKLNDNPYLRLNIKEVIYSPILTTDNKSFTYFVRMSKARNNIAYASVRAPAKIYKEHTLLKFAQLSFQFYNSTHQPLSIDYLDRNADPIDDPTKISSRYQYIRHPLFYYHQIIMSIRIGVIRNNLI